MAGRLNKNDSSNMWLIHVIYTSIVVTTTEWGGDDDSAASMTPEDSDSLKIAEFADCRVCKEVSIHIGWKTK